MAQFGFHIATFLQIDNPESFTSHFGKRTAGTMIANAGGTTLQLQRAGNWKSPRVAEGYVALSTATKKTTSNLIGLLEPKTSLVVKQDEDSKLEEPLLKKVTPDKPEPVYSFTFDFRGSTGVNLSNFSLCNSSIQPQIANNNSTTSVVPTITNDVN